ncbi:hypothetical protein B296_00025172 [Ensete ventricosum]|uniref:Uncharacterized protein n=1 Tax=Ensete ventricosum TaxID=4639 RepID=A0A426Z6Y8_ENSVE|nr:hypothetical protein B296_00025172 [Ensete ventricosum]
MSAAVRPPYVLVISRGTTKDRYPRDDPRNKLTELCIEDLRTDVDGLVHSDETRRLENLLQFLLLFVTHRRELLSHQGGAMEVDEHPPVGVSDGMDPKTFGHFGRLLPFVS